MQEANDATAVNAEPGEQLPQGSAATGSDASGLSLNAANEDQENTEDNEDEENSEDDEDPDKSDELDRPPLTYDNEIQKQLSPRGWTQAKVQATVDNPVATHDVWDFTSGDARQPATAYENSDGDYVVVNDKDGGIVQVSNCNNENWKPVWEDPRFAR
jgi:Colicin E5 ribonuclease domain